MTDPDPKTPRPWFGPKKIGFGYSPRTWEGWVVTIVGAAALVALVVTVRHLAQ